jgi:hypothetical protein
MHEPAGLPEPPGDRRHDPVAAKTSGAPGGGAERGRQRRDLFDRQQAGEHGRRRVPLAGEQASSEAAPARKSGSPSRNRVSNVGTPARIAA